MEKVFISLGSNQGDRRAALNEAIDKLGKQAGTVVCKSQIYETEPWGFECNDKFLNMAISMATNLKPFELLDICQSIEANMGRKRNPNCIGYSSRPIDIDILFYGNEILESERLTIPHPLLHLRHFVLDPLMDIAPEFVHPKLEKSIEKLSSTLFDIEKKQNRYYNKKD